MADQAPPTIPAADGADAPPVDETAATTAAAADASANKKGGNGDKSKKDGKKKDKKEKESKKAAAGGGDKGPAKPLRMEPPPEYLAERLSIFDELYAEQQADIADKAANHSKKITITMPDGKSIEGDSWKTTPYEIAAGISTGLAKDAVVAKVNNVQWDLDRPLEEDTSLEFLKFDHTEGEYVFRHSSAHILGEAMECHLGGCLCYGPPVEDGFYYDTYLDGESITSDSFGPLETLCKQVVKEKQPFQRLVVTKENLKRLFAYNKFKLRIINERIDTPTTTVYRCGPLIDLCRGPHVRHTGKIDQIALTKNSATYWEGNAEAETLQRVYGISFPNKTMMKEWKVIQEEAAKRDHRKIGTDQELFFFHELSPGSCFFLPRGAFIYNTLMSMIKEQYVLRGFSEVITPNMFNSKLWETSGHWEHYKEDMFTMKVEEETFALKPMNCPSHCLMFKHRPRSYKELPMRFADFGVLHRNEAAGALSGLTRVRRFQQDDAHIFCLPSQIEEEIAGALDFLRHVYGVFGFTFELNLSTRHSKKYLGDIETWNKAESALKSSLEKFAPGEWHTDPEGAAFYGPKIDIKIRDALRRPHQCATIQLDFQLPIRFDLEYVPAVANAEPSRPVIIHRAILGSVERMIAILTESYGGKWPFWLNPRQAQIVPVVPAFNDYAVEVKNRLRALGFQVDADVNDSDTLNKKIRNAQVNHYCFIFTVGETEMKTDSTDVRLSTGARQGQRSVAEVIAHFTELAKTRRVEVDFPVKEEEKPAEPPASA